MCFWIMIMNQRFMIGSITMKKQKKMHLFVFDDKIREEKSDHDIIKRNEKVGGVR